MKITKEAENIKTVLEDGVKEFATEPAQDKLRAAENERSRVSMASLGSIYKERLMSRLRSRLIVVENERSHASMASLGSIYKERLM